MDEEERLHRLADPPVRTYTIDALIAEGFSRYAIRKYVRLGILPHAIGRGPSAYYTAVHLDVLREIRRARDENRSLADIRDWAAMRYPHRTVCHTIPNHGKPAAGGS